MTTTIQKSFYWKEEYMRELQEGEAVLGDAMGGELKEVNAVWARRKGEVKPRRGRG